MDSSPTRTRCEHLVGPADVADRLRRLAAAIERGALLPSHVDVMTTDVLCDRDADGLEVWGESISLQLQAASKPLPHRQADDRFAYARNGRTRGPTPRSDVTAA